MPIRPATKPIDSLISIAALSFELQPVADGDYWIQLLPAGPFGPNDGRPLDVEFWYIDESVAQRVIARWRERKNRVVVDYEHQTLHRERNGQPAPAAAWIVDLQWRAADATGGGSGLWARVELTPRASKAIAEREYLYVSPVFVYEVPSGRVLEIMHAAFTNTAAIEGMHPLAALAAATFGHHSHSQSEASMNKLLVALLTALGLPADTTEDQAIAACSALKPKLDTLDAVLGELKVNAQATDLRADAVAACTSLRTASATTTPDPSKYVPIESVRDLQAQVAVLSADVNARKVEDVLAPALADGRVPKALEGWARDLGKKDIAALTNYIKGAQPIAALNGSQTGGQPPAGAKDANGLTADELAVCSTSGIDPKDYAATKASISA